MKKGWKPYSLQNKLVQDSEGNKENGYPDPDSNKTKITQQSLQECSERRNPASNQ
jgi:hypothetical protein